MNNPTATLLERTKSSMIDSLFLIAMGFVIAGLLSCFENVPTWVRATLFSSLLLYEPICISFGTTLGNYIMNIRIRRSTNDLKKLNILRSLIRFTFKLIFGWFSYITLFKNPRKRAIHDLIAGATTIEV